MDNALKSFKFYHFPNGELELKIKLCESPGAQVVKASNWICNINILLLLVQIYSFKLQAQEENKTQLKQAHLYFCIFCPSTIHYLFILNFVNNFVRIGYTLYKNRIQRTGGEDSVHNK